jgi:hypothetical protein
MMKDAEGVSEHLSWGIEHTACPISKLDLEILPEAMTINGSLGNGG